MHPLDGAYARVSRAEEQILYLNRLATEFGEAEKNATKVHISDNPVIKPGEERWDLVTFEYPHSPVPDIFSILIGEILYHLRAALDYLVFELAEFDSGSEQDGTQFPIFDKEGDFIRFAPSCLSGIDKARKAQFEELQPYHSPDNKWFSAFRTLSNRDKHRELRPVLFGTDLRMETEELPAESSDGSLHIKMKFDFTMKIAFRPQKPFVPGPPEEWPWVGPMLQDFAKHIRGILDSFSPNSQQ